MRDGCTGLYVVSAMRMRHFRGACIVLCLLLILGLLPLFG
jgi:hypothetical protein